MRSRAIVLVLTSLGLCSCSPPPYVPELATDPYPANLHTTNVADIQVFRRDTELEIVNSTAQSYRDFNLWLNQRYVKKIDALPAGETVRVSLWDFIDEYGKRFYAGGLFRAYPPTPVRLIEIQTAADQPMIGLIAIRAEEVVFTQQRR